MEKKHDELGSEEPTKPGGPPTVESAIQTFTLAITEIGVDCRESAHAISFMEGDERRRRLFELANKMEKSNQLIGDAARVIRALADLSF
jgi:hypothetical protein